MTLITTIEIDEIDVEVSVLFTAEFGEVEIHEVSDRNGNDVYLDAKNMANICDECHEFTAGNEFIPLENNY